MNKLALPGISDGCPNCLAEKVICDLGGAAGITLLLLICLEAPLYVNIFHNPQKSVILQITSKSEYIGFKTGDTTKAWFFTISEKHKFMEEHGEMPSAGPVISGVKPPQDGWKYVTKSAYMMEDQNGKPPGNEEAETVVRNKEAKADFPSNLAGIRIWQGSVYVCVQRNHVNTA